MFAIFSGIRSTGVASLETEHIATHEAVRYF